jgi:hypothetical protein
MILSREFEKSLFFAEKSAKANQDLMKNRDLRAAAQRCFLRKVLAIVPSGR